MRVLYKSRKLKCLILLQIILVVFTGFGVYPTLSPADGRPQIPDSDWAVPLRECRGVFLGDNREITGLASDNDSEIYMSDIKGYISSYSLPRLELNWTSSLGTVSENILRVDSKNLYIVSIRDGIASLRAISRSTGVTNWQANTKFNDFLSLSQNNDTLFFIGLTTVWAIDKSNGSLKWLKRIQSAPDSKTKSERDSLLILTEGLDLLEVSEPTGSYKKIGSLETRPDIILLDNEGNTFTGDSIGNIRYQGQLRNERRWRAKTGGRITGITSAGNSLIVTSLDNFVYKYTKASGSLVWKKRLSERIYAPGTFREGAPLLIGSKGNRMISLLDPADGRFLNQIDLGEQSILAAGPILTRNLIAIPDGSRLRIFSPEACVQNDGDESQSNSSPKPKTNVGTLLGMLN